MNKLLNYTLIAIATITIVSCKTEQKPVAGVQPALDPANMDTTVLPGNDFYQYANGIWMQNHVHPLFDTLIPAFLHSS